MGLTVDADRVGNTMVTWSPSPILSFGPSGTRPTVARLGSAAFSLLGLLRGCSFSAASPMLISTMRCVQR